MFDDGALKRDDQGRFILVVDPNESEHIRSQRGQDTRRRPMTEADIDRINAEVDEEILQWFLKIDFRYFEICD